MDPVFQLLRLLNRYVRNEIDLVGLQEAFVPMLPYFAERQDREPIARLAVELDNVLVALMTGEAVEDDLKALIEALPNPTVALAGLDQPPTGATSSTVLAFSVPVSGTVRWPINLGAARATLASTQLGVVPA
jgi:hypothetical protein